MPANKKKNIIDKDEVDHNTRIEYRSFLVKSRSDLANSFDKYLLTFATGSLGLSISFTSSLQSLRNLYLLGIGWTSLVFSIFFSLLSIFGSINAYENEVIAIDVSIKTKTDVPADNCWSKLTDAVNILSIFCFTIGIILLSIFYFLNLQGR